MTRTLWVAVLLVACEGKDAPPPVDETDPTGETDGADDSDTPSDDTDLAVDDTDPPPGVGAAGGSVSAAGVTVDVPAGAVSTPVEITIRVEDPGVALPEGWEAAGEVYAITPHGASFAVPVRISLPDAGVDGDIGAVFVLSDPSDTSWEPIDGVTWANGLAEVLTDHLSYWRVAREVQVAACDLSAATAALGAVDVVGARAAFAGCVASFPNDSTARFGLALTELLTADRWSPVASVFSWCGDPGDISGPLYGPSGYVAALRDAWDHNTSITAAEALSAQGVATSIQMLAQPGAVTAERDTLWYVGGVQDSIGIDIYEDREQYTRLRLQIPAGTSGAYQPTDLEGLYLDLDFSVWPGYAAREYWAEEASFVVRQLGDEAGEAIDFDFDITFREPCGAPRCVGLRYAGTVVDTIDATFQDYVWPFDGREPVRDVMDTTSHTALAELDYQCAVPSFASAYAVIDDLIAEFDSLQADFEAAAADPTTRLLFPKTAVWFLSADVELGPTDAAAMAVAMESITASLQVAKMYRLVDESLSFDAFTGQVDDAEQLWDTGGFAGCERTTAYGDDIQALGDELGARALELRDAAAAGIARAALDDLLAAWIDLLGAQPTFGLFDPSVPQARTLRDEATQDFDAIRQSLATDLPVALPSSPAVDVDLGAFFTSPPERATILTNLGIPGLIMAEAPGAGQCGGTELVFHDTFVDWLAHTAGAANVPQRIYDNGFRNNEIPSVLDGGNWSATIDPARDWPFYLSDDLYQSIIW